MRYIWEKYEYNKGGLNYSNFINNISIVKLQKLVRTNTLSVVQELGEYSFYIDWGKSTTILNTSSDFSKTFRYNFPVNETWYLTDIKYNNQSSYNTNMVMVIDFEDISPKNNYYDLYFEIEDKGSYYSIRIRNYETGTYLKIYEAFIDNNINGVTTPGKGDFIGYVSSSSSSTYPNNGESNGYWYKYVSSENFEITNVTATFSNGVLPDKYYEVKILHSESTITEGVPESVINLEISVDGGSYTSLTTLQHGMGTIPIYYGNFLPLNLTTNVRFRARIQDSIGYTQSFWVYSPVYEVFNFKGYVGVNNIARKIKAVYLGVNGVAKKII